MMGEIFRQEQPDDALPWTGERMVTGVGGAIEMEHLHRYFLARDLCRGRDVLDVAAGEGYGSALLAQTASSVTGVELDPTAVAYAAGAYVRANLRFLSGSATALPLDAASVDVVVSFETLEHFFDHDLFLSEVRRVLRPGGLLVLSTPDAATYSGPGSTPNPFHVRELTHGQFADVLKASFVHVALLRQRVMVGSAIVAEDAGMASAPMIYEQRGPMVFEAHRHLPRAPYLIALASDAEASLPASSLFIQTDDPNAPLVAVQAELARLQAVEERVVQGGSLLDETRADAVGLRAEMERLGLELAATGAEMERLRMVEEAARTNAANVRTMEEAAREQDVALRQVMAELKEASDGAREAKSLAEELAQMRSREATSALRARQQVLALARMQHRLSEALAGESTASRETRQASLQVAQERDLLRERLDDAGRERQHLRKEVERLREEAERNARAYDLASRMIIPVWARRLVPAPLRALNRGRERDAVPPDRSGGDVRPGGTRE